MALSNSGISALRIIGAHSRPSVSLIERCIVRTIVAAWLDVIYSASSAIAAGQDLDEFFLGAQNCAMNALAYLFAPEDGLELATVSEVCEMDEITRTVVNRIKELRSPDLRYPQDLEDRVVNNFLKLKDEL